MPMCGLSSWLLLDLNGYRDERLRKTELPSQGVAFALRVLGECEISSAVHTMLPADDVRVSPHPPLPAPSSPIYIPSPAISQGDLLGDSAPEPSTDWWVSSILNPQGEAASSVPNQGQPAVDQNQGQRQQGDTIQPTEVMEKT